MDEDQIPLNDGKTIFDDLGLSFGAIGCFNAEVEFGFQVFQPVEHSGLGFQPLTPDFAVLKA